MCCCLNLDLICIIHKKDLFCTKKGYYLGWGGCFQLLHFSQIQIRVTTSRGVIVQPTKSSSPLRTRRFMCFKRFSRALRQTSKPDPTCCLSHLTGGCKISCVESISTACQTLGWKDNDRVKAENNYTSSAMQVEKVHKLANWLNKQNSQWVISSRFTW